MEGSIVNLNLVTIFYKLLTGRSRKNSLQDIRFGLASKSYTRDLYEPAAAPTDLGRIRPPLNQPLLPSGLSGDGSVLVVSSWKSMALLRINTRTQN